MSKLWTIANREYMVRVKSKSFIIATLLTPIAFGVFFLVSGLISYYSKDKTEIILVSDSYNLTGEKLPSEGTYQFEYSDRDPEESRKRYNEDERYTTYINIPPIADSTAKKVQSTYLSREKLGINSISRIESELAKAIRSQKIDDSEMDRAILKSFDVKVNIENAEFLESSGKSSESKLTSFVGYGLGFFMGFLMYMVIFIYGGMVMRSVMEEKINRIVEVIISSVKPFQLMLGKIIGVGGVGLTQLLFWIILIPAILMIIMTVIGGDASQMASMNAQGGIPPEQLDNIDFMRVASEFLRLNWAMIIPVFIIFFLGGYFIYASLFAAMGAAMGDDMGESQSLMVPIIIPVILAFVMLTPILNNPNGNLAIFGSLFPLFSPILMPARLAFDPPWWQIAVSIVLLVGTVIGMIALAGKIYRVGILLYGKKINLKEIAKWLFYKS